MVEVESKTVLAACPHDCPDTCSMLVTVENGRATNVRGNPDHPFTRGGLCVKVNNYTERVYNPDRILYPLRRSGPKGSGRFERIGWDTALDEIKTRWNAIRRQDGAAAILPYSYLGTQGTLNGLNVGDAFFNRLGATISERTFCDSGASTAYVMTVGPTPGTDPEAFVHAKYIILWACNTISTNLHHWPFIAEAQKRGAKVVVIDPMRSRTAKAADWHLPILPGTDAALALGLINVIINEDLIDHEYVEKYTVGFDELRQRAAEYPAERVAALTGLAADDIRTLAREYATTQPAVIRIGVAIERNPSGGNTVRALSSLPALVGAWRHVGGGILQLPIWAFPVKWDALMRPEWITPGTRVLNGWSLGPALTGELDLAPPIKSLFVYNSNPVVVVPQQSKVLKGLQRDDLFTVVSEQFLTDTARFADLVLPATTQLEQMDIMFSWGHFYLSLNMPAIAPLGEAVPNVELFRRLARLFDFDDPFWQRTDEQMVIDAIDWSSPALEGIDLDLLKREGYARLKVGTPDTYAPHREGAFPTPSGKVELKSSMSAGGDFVLPLFRQGSNEFQSGAPLDPLPTFFAPRETAAADPDRARLFPLRMMSPKSHAYLNSQYGNIERQQRLSGGTQRVLIHAVDAAARGIADGVTIRIYNDRGAATAIASITDDVMPGVVVMPMGYWLDADGSGTVNALNSGRLADYGNAPTFSDNSVEVVCVA
jgi:anaerobic selenocysteine-containing dehydrogenase